MNLRIGIIAVFFAVFFVSCDKDDVVYIDGNIAPPDNTIENVTKENYVNKLYISILGRQATQSEFDAGLAILEKNNLSQANREELVDLIMAEDEYFHNEYEVIRRDMLNSGDTSDVTLFIAIFEQTIASTNDQASINNLNHLIDRLELMQDIIPDLESGTADFPEVHKRCVYNHFYDEINMGTENFVVSMYQNFMFRYPTLGELTNASSMVDGSQSIAFYQIGDSKEDFIDLFLSSEEYYEGQVRTAYLRFLFREPTDEEAVSLSSKYQSNKDFKALQKTILTTDEYVGL